VVARPTAAISPLKGVELPPAKSLVSRQSPPAKPAQGQGAVCHSTPLLADWIAGRRDDRPRHPIADRGLVLVARLQRKSPLSYEKSAALRGYAPLSRQRPFSRSSPSQRPMQVLDSRAALQSAHCKSAVNEGRRAFPLGQAGPTGEPQLLTRRSLTSCALALPGPSPYSNWRR